MQDDKSRESSRRSEADSEEAVQDVCALSQEGSLGSFSDSDRSFKLRMAAAAECVSAPILSCKLPVAYLSGQLRYTGSTDRVVLSSLWLNWDVLIHSLKACVSLLNNGCH